MARRLVERRLHAPIVAALGVAGGISLGHPLDADLWIHLNTGSYLSAFGRLPVPDPFTFGAGGLSWVPHEWLAEWVIYQSIATLGVATTQAAFALLYVGMWLTVARALAICGVRTWVQAAAIILGAVAAGPFSGIRPMQFGLFFLALTVSVLIRHRQSGSRVVWVLPVIFLIWANVHGSFPIGFGVALAVIADAMWARHGLPLNYNETRVSLRAIVPSLILGGSAIAVNPSGPRLWLHPFWQLVTPAREFNSDWNPPELFSQSWWALTIMVAGTVVAVAWGRTRVTPVLLVTILVLVALSISARKSMAFGSVAIVSLLARPLSAIERPNWSLPSGLQRNVAALALVISIALGGWLGPKSLTGPSVVPMPHGARDYLAVTAPARIWNTYHWGGFLTWKLWPESQLFIDGRYDPFVGEALSNYLDVVSLDSRWRELLQARAPGAVVVESASALARSLESEPGWTVGYRDPVATVFLPAAGD